MGPGSGSSNLTGRSWSTSQPWVLWSAFPHTPPSHPGRLCHSLASLYADIMCLSPCVSCPLLVSLHIQVRLVSRESGVRVRARPLRLCSHSGVCVCALPLSLSRDSPQLLLPVWRGRGLRDHER